MFNLWVISSSSYIGTKIHTKGQRFIGIKKHLLNLSGGSRRSWDVSIWNQLDLEGPDSFFTNLHWLFYIYIVTYTAKCLSLFNLYTNRTMRKVKLWEYKDGVPFLMATLKALAEVSASIIVTPNPAQQLGDAPKWPSTGFGFPLPAHVLPLPAASCFLCLAHTRGTGNICWYSWPTSYRECLPWSMAWPREGQNSPRFWLWDQWFSNLSWPRSP